MFIVGYDYKLPDNPNQFSPSLIFGHTLPFWLVKNPLFWDLGPSQHFDDSTSLRGDGIYLLVGVVMMPQWGMKKICQERLVGHLVMVWVVMNGIFKLMNGVMFGWHVLFFRAWIGCIRKESSEIMDLPFTSQLWEF